MILTIDNALNLVWLAISLAAMGALGVRNCRGAGGAFAVLRRLFAIVVMALALFPALSDSDDLFSFSLLESHAGSHGRSGSSGPTEDPQEKAGVQWLRMLDCLEHSTPAPAQVFTPILLCAAISLSFRLRLTSRAVICRRGRAPPASA